MIKHTWTAIDFHLISPITPEFSLGDGSYAVPFFPKGNTIAFFGIVAVVKTSKTGKSKRGNLVLQQSHLCHDMLYFFGCQGEPPGCKTFTLNIFHNNVFCPNWVICRGRISQYLWNRQTKDISQEIDCSHFASSGIVWWPSNRRWDSSNNLMSIACC